MADETTTVAPTEEAITPSAGTEATAPQELDQQTPEVPAPKTFTQEELDAIVGKRLAIEKRKFERTQAMANPPKPIEVKPLEDYANIEEYTKDVAAKAVETAKHNSTVEEELSNFSRQVDKAVEKYPDFTEVAFSHPFMTDDMAKAIRVSPVATELAYHLGKNLEEAERISELSPVGQIRELMRLEAKLEAAAPAKPAVSSAPAPIKPVGAKGAVPSTDPEKMSMEDYRELRKKQGASWAR